MRKYAIAAGLIATVLICAPLVAAKGPGGGWGKGLLSESVTFTVEEPTGAEGDMFWSPDVTEVFVFDFHGLYLEEDTLYYLIYYYTADEDGPDEYEILGSMDTEYCEIGTGVHVKGTADPPPVLTGLTFCLVPESWMDLGGDWTPEEYLIAEDVEL